MAHDRGSAGFRPSPEYYVREHGAKQVQNPFDHLLRHLRLHKVALSGQAQSAPPRQRRQCRHTQTVLARGQPPEPPHPRRSRKEFPAEVLTKERPAAPGRSASKPHISCAITYATADWLEPAGFATVFSCLTAVNSAFSPSAM